MNAHTDNIIIRTGTDPRHLPEFTALREEINKLNHPARPEMNWKLVESLSLAIFRTHGVDLQTTCYYTLARTQLNGLQGFTEGCEMMAGLVVSQWDNLWPEQPHARSEMLEWFNARVGNYLRQMNITADDLRLIYRLERALQLITDKLQQVNLKKVPRIENLLYFVQNAAQRIEKAHEAQKKQTESVAPAAPLVFIPSAIQQPTVTPSVQQGAYSEQITTALPSPPLPPKRVTVWHGVMAGIGLCALLAGLFYHFTFAPLQTKLTRFETEFIDNPKAWIINPSLATYDEQMSRIAAQSPLLPIIYGNKIASIAQQNWPENSMQQQVTRRWQQLLQAKAGNNLAPDHYHQAQHQLQQLIDRLLYVEKNKGSLTISYLKSMAYAIQQNLNGDVPLEERLRQLADYRKLGAEPPPILLKQIDERIDTLLIRYYQIGSGRSD